jgi:zinc/manganese transport system permease protein
MKMALSACVVLSMLLLQILAAKAPDPRGTALLFLPFLACVLLIGIHTYFGIHVLSRGIIFVDLSLAQVASLGAIVAFALGFPLHTRAAALLSLAIAVIAAFLFSVSRSRVKRLPQEALIGIVYAVSSALAILLIDKHPEGIEVIKASLAGEILWVSARSIISTAATYAAVAVFHVLFFEKFVSLSGVRREDGAREARAGVWDFLFYTSFAVIITKSVEISGILLVFSYLVIPAVVSSLFLRGIAKRLLAGWSLGIAASAAGLLCSYRYDIAAGPVIVVFLTFTLVVAGFLKYITASDRRLAALARLGAGVSALVAILSALYFTSPLVRSGTVAEGHSHAEQDELALHGGAEHEGGDHPPGTHALHLLDHYFADPGNVTAREALAGHVGDLVELLSDESPEVRERVSRALGEVASGSLVERELEEAFAGEEDDWIRFEMAKSLFALDWRKGGRLILSLMKNDDLPILIKKQGLELLSRRAGSDLGYDPDRSAYENREALERWETFIGIPDLH